MCSISIYYYGYEGRDGREMLGPIVMCFVTGSTIWIDRCVHFAGPVSIFLKKNDLISFKKWKSHGYQTSLKRVNTEIGNCWRENTSITVMRNRAWLLIHSEPITRPGSKTFQSLSQSTNSNHVSWMLFLFTHIHPPPRIAQTRSRSERQTNHQSHHHHHPLSSPPLPIRKHPSCPLAKP